MEMKRYASKRVELFKLIKLYNELGGNARKVNVGFIKSLDLEELEEEIRRVRDFIGDLQHFQPIWDEYERLDRREHYENEREENALHLEDIEDRLMERRTRRASDILQVLEKKVSRLEMRRAKFEGRTSNSLEILLATLIKEKMKGVRVDFEDLIRDPEYINLDDISYRHNRVQQVIESWESKGYVETTEGAEVVGFMELDDLDMTTLTKKGVLYVKKLLSGSRQARSYQPSEQEAIEESLQLTEYKGWKVLTGPERQSYLSDVWDMYTTTYRKIGITVKDPKVLAGKYAVWYVHFDDGLPVAFNLFKKTSFGMKSALSGNDGSSVGRKVSKNWIRTRWRSVNGFYGEVSGAVEHISIKSGAPVVCAAHVPKVLGKPTNGYGDDNVHYVRNFAGTNHTKVMIGNPRGINTLPFQKALVQCPIPDESVRLARHEKTSALEDRLASDCSAYENSLFSRGK